MAAGTRIENDKLQVQVNEFGGELSSILDKKTGNEIIWQADPKYWKRYAPILFPNVGKYYKGCYRTEGQEYESGQHGFARDMEFVLMDSSQTKCTYRLRDNEDTLKKYPYKFQLDVTHEVKENQVKITWEVTNTDSRTIYFTIGAHPAFNLPGAFDDENKPYRISFPDTKELEYLLIDPEYGTAVTDKPYKLPLEQGTMAVTKDRFDLDAMIFDGGQIQEATILSPEGKPYLTMISPDFPSYGIWSVPGAPYVCLEPWMGRCDNTGFTGLLSEKENVNVLKPGEVFCKEYTLVIR